MGTTSETIQAHTDGAVLRIVLNRPDRLNALDESACAALRCALQAAVCPQIRAVLVTGVGRAFCAGQDLSERKIVADGGTIDLGAALQRNWNPIVLTIRQLPKPVIAAVNGIATGAGANLALACDIVLAARSARFVQPFARLGLIPDAGGTYHLPRLVGLARATALMMLAEPVSAEQAVSWGMIWKAVDDDTLADEASAMAAALAAAPTYGLAQTKAALNRSAASSLDGQLVLESELQRATGFSPDYAEALRAFFEKRTPQFTGQAPPTDE